MHDYDPKMPSNIISEDLSVYQNFPGGHVPRTPQHWHAMHADSALHNNLHFLSTYHTKFFIHTVLQLISLTNEKLLLTALN